MRPDDPPVRNATPDPIPVPLVLACLARGLPVLLEKPVIDAADAARTLAAILAVHVAAAVQPQRAVSPPSTGRSTPLI